MRSVHNARSVLNDALAPEAGHALIMGIVDIVDAIDIVDIVRTVVCTM